MQRSIWVKPAPDQSCPFQLRSMFSKARHGAFQKPGRWNQEVWQQLAKWSKKAKKTAGQNVKMRLAELRYISENVFLDRVGSGPSRKRELLGSARDGLHAKLIGKPCVACGRPAQCRHHLVQLQNNGGNSRGNVVGLCHDCHEQVHPWLAEKNRRKEQHDHHPIPVRSAGTDPRQAQRQGGLVPDPVPAG